MVQPLLSTESFINYRWFDHGVLNPSTAKQSQPNQNFITYSGLLESELFALSELNCYHDSSHLFVPNYSNLFSINITRRGYFSFESYRHSSEEYANRILLQKPGCGFKYMQQVPGAGRCTVLGFTEKGYNTILEQIPGDRICFFNDPDWFSAVVDANADIDYLHHLAIQLVRQSIPDRFAIDCIIMELMACIVDLVLGSNPLHQPPCNVRRNHLQTIERAKEYMLEHFTQSISLKDLARYCHVSEFHFTRTFKQICGYMPFEYLQQLRLKSAEVLLRSTELPMNDVAYQCGFTRPDYFTAAFSKKRGLSPRQFRKRFNS